MISVLLKCKENGVLLECFAQGHAEYAAIGSDIVCSAVTILLKTTLSLLEKTDGIELKSDTQKRGVLAFSVKMRDCGSHLEQMLVYAADFLETGLQFLAMEYPHNVKFVKERA